MGDPLLFILTGPSGVGKATVAREVFKRVPCIAKVVTYATREIRPGEENHITYHFVSEEEFRRKIDAGELFEWEKVYGDAFYGSPRDPFENVPEGHDALLEIGVGGMRSYRETFPHAVTLFLAPPSMDAILDRIAKRGGQEANLDNRLQGAMQMVDEVERYQYIIVNDRLEEAVAQVAAVIQAERCKHRRGEVARRLRQQLLDWKAKHGV